MLRKSLLGNLLVANPLNPQDNLSFGVVLIASQSSKTTFGIRLNLPSKIIPLESVFEQMGLAYFGSDFLYTGGNTNRSKVHVVHSLDWSSPTTIRINDEIGITGDVSVLEAISDGHGPKNFRACSGYWIWDNKLLHAQVSSTQMAAEYSWELAPATAELVFEYDRLDQWHRAIEVSADVQSENWVNLFLD